MAREGLPRTAIVHSKRGPIQDLEDERRQAPPQRLVPPLRQVQSVVVPQFRAAFAVAVASRPTTTAAGEGEREIDVRHPFPPPRRRTRTDAAPR